MKSGNRKLLFGLGLQATAMLSVCAGLFILKSPAATNWFVWGMFLTCVGILFSVLFLFLKDKAA